MDDKDLFLDVARMPDGRIQVTDFDGQVRHIDRSGLDRLVVSVRRALDETHALPSRSAASDPLADEHRIIADISRRAVRDGIDDLLAFTADAVATLVDTECASIFEHVAGTDELVVVAYSGPEPRPAAVPGGDGSSPGFAWETGQAVVCNDSTLERRFSTATMDRRGLRSGVSVPIAGDTRPWGVLSVHVGTPRVYSAQELAFLSTVCDILSAAIRRAELENQLRRRGLHDPLTGLPNRELVHEHLGLALAHTESTGGRIAVLLVDFDNFKSINDHFGHDIGDVALIAVAQRLRETVSSMHSVSTGGSDSVFRLGGDEFLVLLNNTVDAEQAAETARAIGSALREPLTIEGRSVPLSASIGIALSESAVQLRQLVHRADVAMYRAKSQRPGGYAVYDADDDRQARHHLTMSTDLRAAIVGDDLSLRYVPIVDAASNELHAYAAVPRWDHPALGPLEPTEFVTTAERTGLIDALGTWIFRRACSDAASWLAENPAIHLRVDIVATQLRLRSFVTTVLAAVDDAGMSTNQLVLGIPEAALEPHNTALDAVLEELRSAGVRLLLDNSSGGHSAIRNLSRTSFFEFFQLDDADVEATFREHSATVLKSVVGLIHTAGVKVVAGSIADLEQLSGAADTGCDLAMGSAFGPESTPHEVLSAIRLLPDRL